MSDKIRKLEVNSFIITVSSDECSKIKGEIEKLEILKEEKLKEVGLKKDEINILEGELLSIEENIKIYKENKSKLMEKIEELKRLK